MSTAPLSVGSHEFILRRVHKNHYDASQPFPTQPAAFRPSPSDTAGLSVYRESLISPVEVAATGRRPGDYYVVRLSVQTLHALNLSVIPDELTDGPRGHALIPELSVTAYQQNKQGLKGVLTELARLASQAVVYTPTQ
ncbi:MAG: hypothetical protein HY000_01110 [Planctomycetes bacterium]|nr:hypothetical protein [Planctomycetota bacterium]